MTDDEAKSGGVVALGPLHWTLAKVRRDWSHKIAALEAVTANKKVDLESQQRKERRALSQRLKASRDTLKASTPLNGRLAAMQASRDNLVRLGRVKEAEKVRTKLEPLEEGFWAKIFAANGDADRANQLKNDLLGAQQLKLGSLNRELQRDIEQAVRARDAEVKAQQRKNRSSSDDVWSIWSAAKSGEAGRLSYMLAKSPEKANARDPDSAWTPLHFASRQGKLEAVHVLVEKKAVVEARGPDSRTPLHLAAGWGTYEVCFALLQAGADKNVVDLDGCSPQHLAQSRQREKVVNLLRKWEPIGLTYAQIQAAKAQGPARPWEAEGDPAIRAQLRSLGMKRAMFGEKHAGTSVTLGKLACLCRATGRLEEAKEHLEQLVKVLQAPTCSENSDPHTASWTGHTVPSLAKASSPRHHGIDPSAIAVAIGNLGIVCRDLGHIEQASGLLEKSLAAARSAITGAACYNRGDTTCLYVAHAAARNLGLHYLSEGRVKEAQPLLRSVVEHVEKSLEPDIYGGHESVDLIPPLTLLSYADMLAGDHTAAAYNAERARKIAAVNREYTGLQLSMLPSPGAGPDDTAAETVTVTGNAFLANPIFRLEWMGVYRFAAGQHASAGNAFARARALVVEQQQQSWNDRTHFNAFALGNDAGADGMVLSAGDLLSTIRKTSIRAAALRRVASDKDSRRGQDEAAAVVTAKAVEFHPEAMRLDRCTAVAICRQGPEAF